MFPIRLLALLALVSITAACAPAGPPPKDFTAFRTADPHSILIVPVTNKTTQVDAPDNFLATLAYPIAERGYYVFPINMVRRTMEDNGLSDADLVASADPTVLARMFGADAVLYASVERWDAQYIVLTTSIQVSIHYTLKSGKTGATLWDSTVSTVYQPSASSGNPIAALIADAIVAAIERAHPNYIPLAVQTNTIAFYTKGQSFPVGPYDPNYRKDE